MNFTYSIPLLKYLICVGKCIKYSVYILISSETVHSIEQEKTLVHRGTFGFIVLVFQYHTVAQYFASCLITMNL